MRALFSVVAAIVLIGPITCVSAADTNSSPYAGQQMRTIKALSADDIAAPRDGGYRRCAGAIARGSPCGSSGDARSSEPGADRPIRKAAGLRRRRQSKSRPPRRAPALIRYRATVHRIPFTPEWLLPGISIYE